MKRKTNYDIYIKRLQSILERKRRIARWELEKGIREDVGGVMESMLEVKGRVWERVKALVRENPEGVLRWVLSKYPMGDERYDRRLMEVLVEAGYGDYGEKINEYLGLRKRLDKCRGRGVSVDYSEADRRYYKGDVEGGLELMREMEERCRRASFLRGRWEEIRDMAEELGVEVPDVGGMIDAGELEEAEKAMRKIDVKGMRRRLKYLRERKEVESILDSLSDVAGVSELRERLDGVKGLKELRVLRREVERLRGRVERILKMSNDSDVRRSLGRDLDEALKIARVKYARELIE